MVLNSKLLTIFAPNLILLIKRDRKKNLTLNQYVRKNQCKSP